MDGARKAASLEGGVECPQPAHQPCLISLHCDLTGYPGQDITQSQYYSFNMVQRNNVMNATLRINELSPALIGDYNCSASNVVDGTSQLSCFTMT